jgi:hypothetical protein
MKSYSLRHKVVSALVVAAAMVPSVDIYAGNEVPGSDTDAPLLADTAATENPAVGAAASRTKAQESVNALSGDIQELKQSVIALNKDLRILEEDLLFPANTQVNVFLSLDVGRYFTLESVKLKLDDQVVASHIYTEKELIALKNSGIHKLHMANLSIGKHSLSAFFTGIGPKGREYKRGTTMKIDKENGPKYIELKISDSTSKLQPEFEIKEW